MFTTNNLKIIVKLLQFVVDLSRKSPMLIPKCKKKT